MVKTDLPSNDDRYGYSRTALARLVLSQELSELSDQAAGSVPTTNDEYASPGAMVEDAQQLIHQAQQVLAAAVIYERERGTSWETIGDRLDITRQSAHQRWRDDMERWKLALVEPLTAPDGRGLHGQRLHEAAYRPTKWGHRLDEWARARDSNPTVAGIAAEHPVTGGLPTLSTLEEMNQMLAGLQHLYGNLSTPPDPVERLRLNERKAALLERIAVEQGTVEARETADAARAHVAQLRAELDDPE